MSDYSFWDGRGTTMKMFYLIFDLAITVGMVWNIITADWLAVGAYALISISMEVGLLKHKR